MPSIVVIRHSRQLSILLFELFNPIAFSLMLTLIKIGTE